MCRIFGVKNTNHIALDISQLNGYRDQLAYGGPDDAGEFIDESNELYLGHRRLSIIDTSAAGHQPMQWGNWVICYNGEVYNFREIGYELQEAGYELNTASDTEVIIKAFDCWGYEAVQKFRGMFAFALWNRETKKLLLCRDRVGVKPLYYYHKDGLFLFASELKAIHQYPGFDNTIDQDAVSLYLQAGYIKSPYSIYKFVRKLEPRHFLEIDTHGEIRKWVYWSVEEASGSEVPSIRDQVVGSSDRRFDSVQTSRRSDESTIAHCESLLTESCQLRMIADVAVGVFLSGGIDSSLVTALLQHHSNSKINTFTIGFEDAGFDESIYAKEIAHHLGTNHHTEICTEQDFLDTIDKLPEIYDEPFGDSSGIPTQLVAQIAKKNVTVALSADGGDEVFGGYTRYTMVQGYYNKLKSYPLWLRKGVAQTAATIPTALYKTTLALIGKKQLATTLDWRLPKLLNTLQATDPRDMYAKGFTNITEQWLQALHTSDAIPFLGNETSKWDDGYWISELGKLDVQTYLEGDILTKVDRATMQVALEGREPLLDHKIIEFGLSLPDEYKIRNGETKWLLRQVLKKFIPEHLWNRPKQGFGIPIKQWLENNFKTELLNIPTDTIFLERFRLQKETLEKILSQFLSGKATINPHFIWSLFVLYRWHKRWK